MMNDMWILEYGGQSYGPFTVLQVAQMLQNNQISEQTLLKSSSTGGYFKTLDIVKAIQQNTPPTVHPNMVSPMVQPNMVSPMVQPNMVTPMVQPGITPEAIHSTEKGFLKKNIQKITSLFSIPEVDTTYQQNYNTPVQENETNFTTPVNETASQTTENTSSNSVSQTNDSSKDSLRNWIDRSNIENGTIVCPHCWGNCSLETILFISAHPELVGDTLLGPDAAKRFLPKYFTAKGTAFDEKGMECSDMACPHCHLKIPNAIIDLPSSYFSIVGAPASGKSYFLTAMIWQLRKALPTHFNFSLFDTDPSFNTVLNDYERILFLNPDRKEYVSLPKTELQGKGFSNQILIENNSIDLPRPFVFTLIPQESHPYFGKDGLERSIVLYDNAGEHFETGRDSISNLATIHLVHSDGIIFLYDPLKDVRLMQKCSDKDPQMSHNLKNMTNQITIFTEMVARIHKHCNSRANEKYKKPLIVVVPKYDAWKDSFPLDVSKEKLVIYDQDVTPYLNMDAVCSVSFCLRKYLLSIAPEIVGLAEGFAEKVLFVPVSALGKIPEYDESKAMIGIKPDNLAPIWAEVPFLLQLHFNGLLQAAYMNDENIPCITHYQCNRGHISFVFPETNERATLPSFYCGKTVYCSESGTYYRLPAYHTEQPQESAESVAKEDDAKDAAQTEKIELPNQDFWTK